MEKEEIVGYTIEEAVAEARRCLNCPKPLCRTGCPIENEIPAFNHAVSVGNFGEAFEIISRKSNLPAICGRVCPHENQCEGHCVLARSGKGIKVGMIRPITLWPFPSAPIREAAEKCHSFISVELSMGQMIEDVRLAVEGKAPVTLCNRTGGMIPSPEQVLEAIEAAAKKEA